MPIAPASGEEGWEQRFVSDGKVYEIADQESEQIASHAGQQVETDQHAGREHHHCVDLERRRRRISRLSQEERRVLASARGEPCRRRR